MGINDFELRLDSMLRISEMDSFPRNTQLSPFHVLHAMNADEYDNLEKREGLHWYYAGKRAMARELILRARPPSSQDRLLDCGAGTGRFAEEMATLCQVLVLDNHEQALRRLRLRFKPEQVLALAGDDVSLPDASLEYVTALDVLEHTLDDYGVVRGFHRMLKPGGVAVITVPAGMALWSDWDTALHHHRRYSRRQLRALFRSDEWEILHCNYTNVLVYPAVWLVRRCRKWFPALGGDRFEDRIPAPWLNTLLRWQFVNLGLCSIPMPFGVSLALVACKR